MCRTVLYSNNKLPEALARLRPGENILFIRYLNARVRVRKRIVKRIVFQLAL